MSPSFRWLSVALLMSLVPAAARMASAGTPSVQLVKHHDHDDDDDGDDDDWWKHHDRDEWKHGRWKRHHKGDDARCGEILDRMRFDGAKIREIEPTGRHRKALQWYRDDLGNARNDLDRCRHGD
jgi:hypothetical protein